MRFRSSAILVAVAVAASPVVAATWIDADEAIIECRRPVSNAEAAALALLQERARLLRGREFPETADATTRSVAGARLHVGVIDDASLSAPQTPAAVRSLKGELGRARDRDQTYVIGPALIDGRPVVIAKGAGPAGAAFAIADLATRLLRLRGKVGFLLEEMHAETPVLSERGIYLNIASPCHPIAVHEWDERQWGPYLDALLAARINRIYLYLWMDVNSPLPGESPWPDISRRLHERLAWMIPQAQRRGMKVVCLFTPTFIPKVVWQRNPAVHAKIEYVDHGFACVCPSNPDAWPLMHRVYDAHIERFRGADGFQLWFYDPGGCMCERCRADLCGPLLRQVEEFRHVVRRQNPNAGFQVSLWPIWVWEEKLKVPYGRELLDRLKRQWPADSPLPDIVDDCGDTPNTFLRPAAERGFRTQAFIFATNIETSFIFLNPMLNYGRAAAGSAVENGAHGAFCHRIEAGSKSAGDFLNACWLWNPAVDEAEVLRRYARWTCGDEDAAGDLVAALALWNAALYDGNASEADWVRIGRRLAAVANATPAAFGERLTVLRDTADCLALIAAGASAAPDEQNRLAGRLRDAMQESATFRAYAPRAVSEYPGYVRWLKKGWRAERF